MGCVQSYLVADGIINELIDHFKILNCVTPLSFTYFTVNSIKISSRFEKKGIRDISNYIKKRISKGMFAVDTMNDEEFFNIYIARKLMCLFFNFQFVEPMYRSFSEWNIERQYFDSVKIKPEYVATLNQFKTIFYTGKGGCISPDTTDENIIHALEAKLIFTICTLVTKFESEISNIAFDAANSLVRQKQIKKTAQDEAFSTVI